MQLCLDRFFFFNMVCKRRRGCTRYGGKGNICSNRALFLEVLKLRGVRYIDATPASTFIYRLVLEYSS